MPAPDRLEAGLPEGHICLVTDDGSDTAVALVGRLQSVGWRVVALRLPESERSLVSAGEVVSLTGANEEAVQEALGQVRAAYGPVGAFVYLHRRAAVRRHLDEILDPDVLAQLAVPFLAAKHLYQELTSAGAVGRACFVTVTFLDGLFGLAGGGAADPAGSGVAGLTKSLRLEWPEVFCRAVDLDPRFGADAAADAILAELRDPNHLLAEVAYGAQGRLTLDAAPDALALDTAPVALATHGPGEGRSW